MKEIQEKEYARVRMDQYLITTLINMHHNLILKT